MPGVKIIDRDPRAGRRRLRAWECFDKAAINPKDLKDIKDAYIAIVKTEQINLIKQHLLYSVL